MALIATINPGKGKRKAKRKTAHKRKSNPRKAKSRARVISSRKTKTGRSTLVRVSNPRKRRARRRNPVLSGSGLTAALMPALTGAAGAIVVDMVWDRVAGYLPVSVQSGVGKYAAIAGLALALGYGLEKTKLVKPGTRNGLVLGSLVVTAYNAAQDIVMPAISGGVTMIAAPTAPKAITTTTTTAAKPATTVKGFQTINGFQPRSMNGLGMVNSGMVVGDYSQATYV